MAEEGETKLVLKPEVIKRFLSCLDYTPERDCLQYLHLNMANKRIDALNNSILDFKNIQCLDLSGNNIVDVNLLQQLEALTKLNLARNKVKNITLFTNEANFPNLKWLDISNNKYTELAAFKLPKLDYLDISFNKLEKVNEGWTGHPNLLVLKSADNRFKNMSTFKDLPRLEELVLASNSVSVLNGWENMGALKSLDLSKNKIEKIEEEIGSPFEALTCLNLASNKISKFDEFVKLFQFTALVDINVAGCPIERQFSSFNMLLSEVLIVNPKVKRFSKVDVTDKEKLEAVYLARYRWEKSEEERIRKEEEERRKAEAEEQEEQ